MADLRQRPGDQPLPTPNGSTDIQSLVIADIVARRELGIERYGTPLQAHNGRDALRDAYEEAIDLAMYLRQAIEERDALIRRQTADDGVSASQLDDMFADMGKRAQEITLGCTCTPATGRQDDCPVHYDHAYDAELAERPER